MVLKAKGSDTDESSDDEDSMMKSYIYQRIWQTPQALIFLFFIFRLIIILNKGKFIKFVDSWCIFWSCVTVFAFY